MEIGGKLQIMVIGSGGREHALCWKLAQSELIERIYCAPGNGGTATELKTENVNIAVMDFDAIAAFALENKIDLVVVGPDNPIAEGLVDFLSARGLRVFGPEQSLARLEASKAFAKQFMVEHQIPTARFMVAHNLKEAVALVHEHPWARVIKVDGLALGKGVFVCDSAEEAEAALNAIFRRGRFGKTGEQPVVIEEKLSGEELSLLLFCDGKRLVAMPALQDHKRRFDGDRGPNTGGMGAFSPVEIYHRCQAEIETQILEPLRKAMRERRFDYRGVLFIGIMVESRRLDGQRICQPYVLEFNARFGDPETQAILPLLRSDLLPVLWACTEGRLHEVELEWSRKASCCVVAATEAYPEGSSKGEPISVGSVPAGAVVFHAGTQTSAGKLLTSGGRILSVTGTGSSLTEAVEQAYSGLEGVSFAGKAFRRDIARRKAAACPSR